LESGIDEIAFLPCNLGASDAFSAPGRKNRYKIFNGQYSVLLLSTPDHQPFALSLLILAWAREKPRLKSVIYTGRTNTKYGL
jgi:hypothetical protein